MHIVTTVRTSLVSFLTKILANVQCDHYQDQLCTLMRKLPHYNVNNDKCRYQHVTLLNKY